MARVLWWEVISRGPFLLLPVLFGLAYFVWIVAWLAFNILKLVLYLAVVLPLSFLGSLRKREPPPRPLLSDDPRGELAPGSSASTSTRSGSRSGRAPPPGSPRSRSPSPWQSPPYALAVDLLAPSGAR